MFKNLLRENIRKIVENTSEDESYNASSEMIYLDKNENPFGSALAQNYNRFRTDTNALFLDDMSHLKAVPKENILPVAGNFDAIDLLCKAFCEPRMDNILICPPTDSIFEKIATIQDIETRKILLITDYQLDIEGIAAAIDERTKIIFLCSPNNPTGNSLRFQDLEIILHNFDGLLVLDESYINFSRQKTLTQYIKDFPNLIVLQNFSFAWALVSENIGMIFAEKNLVSALKKLQSNNPVTQSSMEIVRKSLENRNNINQWIRDIVMMRNYLVQQLSTLDIVTKVYPSDTNFLLVRFNVNVTFLSNFLKKNNLLIKNCHTIALCENCLRISVGNISENEQLLRLLKSYQANEKLV